MAHATHEQAQLHLQLYDMRREAKLRHARDWFFKNYSVNSLEDAMRLAAPGTEEGALAMMVVTYWEQACALLRHELLNEDLFFETTMEFFGVWERVKPMVPAARAMWKDPGFLKNLERAVERFEAWSEKTTPGRVPAMREFMERMRPQAGAAQGA